MSSIIKQPTTPAPEERADNRRSWRFWLIFFALCLSLFLTALDLASVSTALPIIVHDLRGDASFAWVSAAYTLSSTAILPLCGRLAEIFGRRSTMLNALALFTVGSAVTASAQSMNMLIAGRAVQGIGSGGINALTQIVIADLVTLKERGFFNALTGATFSFASAIGPFIGGAIAQRTSWRWLFYINLPLCAIAITVVVLFLHVKKPPHSDWKNSLIAIDWLGNLMIIGSTISCILATTWAGVKYPWGSIQVITPLTIGVLGLMSSFVYEARVPRNPSIPLSVISNRTTLSGYFGSFMHGLVINAVAFYLPAYFQAVKAAPPLLSGLYIFPTAIAISPSAIVQGIIIGKTGRYRVVSIIGWCAMVVGVGSLQFLGVNTPFGATIPIQIVAAVGFGFLYSTTFSVLAPLDVSQNSSALTLLLFARTFSQSWSISIGATILQNELRQRLPLDFLSTIPMGEDIAYSIIPRIHTLPEPLQSQVRTAFDKSLVILWRVLLVFCVVGLVSVALQKEIPLHSKTDEKWGMKDSDKTDTKGREEEGCATKAGEKELSKPVIVTST